MVPLTLMLIFNVVMIVIEFLRKPGSGRDRSELIRQVGIFALAWGVFSTVIGFFYAFGDLSRSGDSIPFEHIMGGLRVALITAWYGLIVFLVSLAGFILLRQFRKSS